jgi:hypothetical protein
LLQSHVLIHDSVVFVIPKVARVEEAFHNLPARVFSRMRTPCRDLPPVHE